MPARAVREIGTVDVADRCPGGLAIAAVDATDQLAHLAIHVGVFLDVGAAGRTDLQIGDMAAPFGVGGEETLIAFHAGVEALRIVEPVDAQDHATSAQAVIDLAREDRTLGVAREPGENPGLDADRERFDAHGSAIDVCRSSRHGSRGRRQRQR